LLFGCDDNVAIGLRLGRDSGRIHDRHHPRGVGVLVRVTHHLERPPAAGRRDVLGGQMPALSDDQYCVVATPKASLVVRLYCQYSNSLLNSALYVEHYSGVVLLERGRYEPHKKHDATVVAESTFHLAIAEDDEWGWRAKSGDIVSSARLADQLTGKLFDMYHKATGR
jgi:hypothetical protein